MMNEKRSPVRSVGVCFRVALILPLLLLAGTVSRAEAFSPPDKLRVCSDPNNLPFSHKNEQGFENKIARLLATSLKLPLEYTWFPQRMGFIRNTLLSWSEEEGRFKCDLVMGVPAEFDMTDTTAAYYRSSYVLAYKDNGRLAGLGTGAPLEHLSPQAKRDLTLGAFVPSPSVNWLQRRGLFEQAKIYRTLSGDPDYYPGRLIEEDLVAGKIDGAIIWGPIAGYFIRRVNETTTDADAHLKMLLLRSEPDIRFDFAIAMGIRRGENAWKRLIEQTVEKNKAAITDILNEYQVPLLPTDPPG